MIPEPGGSNVFALALHSEAAGKFFKGMNFLQFLPAISFEIVMASGWVLQLDSSDCLGHS
jgi:hypothetical protein